MSTSLDVWELYDTRSDFSLDGQDVATGPIDKTVVFFFALETIDVGQD